MATHTTRARNAANDRWHREASRPLTTREQQRLDRMVSGRPQLTASFDLVAWQAERRTRQSNRVQGQGEQHD